MKTIVSGWVLVALLVLPSQVSSQEGDSEEDEFLGEESVLEEEEDFPDLIRIAETGGVFVAGIERQA